MFSFSTGGTQIVVPGFHRAITQLDSDGHHTPGSPFDLNTEAYFHTSPLLMDYNNDGVKDIIWISVNGDIYIIK